MNQETSPSLLTSPAASPKPAHHRGKHQLLRLIQSPRSSDPPAPSSPRYDSEKEHLTPSRPVKAGVSDPARQDSIKRRLSTCQRHLRALGRHQGCKPSVWLEGGLSRQVCPEGTYEGSGASPRGCLNLNITSYRFSRFIVKQKTNKNPAYPVSKLLWGLNFNVF